MSEIFFVYCSNPKCPKGAEWWVQFGCDYLGACRIHYNVLARSYPTVAGDRSTKIAPGFRVPLGYELIKQVKRVDGKFTVKRTIGGQKQ